MTGMAKHQHPGHAGEHHADDGDAICPVCRAAVDSATAPMQVHQGEAWYFCNDRCLTAFEKRSGFYAERARAERAR